MDFDQRMSFMKPTSVNYIDSSPQLPQYHPLPNLASVSVDPTPCPSTGYFKDNSTEAPTVVYSESVTASAIRRRRFNPIAVPAARPTSTRRKRRSTETDDDSDNDPFEDFQVASTNPINENRREAVRRQRIESEQRRRDELREGYARLKSILPPTNQKTSKVSLLDRAASHIQYLESIKEQFEALLKETDNEGRRLHDLQKRIMLTDACAVPRPTTATAPLTH